VEADMNNLEENVKKIISERLRVTEEEIKLESKFSEDLDTDSLTKIELIMDFEEVFDLRISDDEAEAILTVKDAIEYIKNNTKPWILSKLFLN
jgi:acyl carrier protein